MKGLDTNVLIRYLTQDDPEQSKKANKYIHEVIDSGDSLFINQIVLCELVWVLDSAYGYSKAIIIDVIERILATAQFEVASKNLIWGTLDDFRRGKADFADYLIGRLNVNQGCSETASFDTVLSKQQGFKLL